MNKKLTTYFLRMLRNKHEKQRARYTEDEENYYLCDGYFLRVVKKEEMELNIKLFNESKALKGVIEDTKDEKYKDAEIKYWIPDKRNKGKFIIKIVNDEMKTYISNKYLELFEGYTSFKVIGKLKPVLCYKNETLLGLILPIRVEEEY